MGTTKFKMVVLNLLGVLATTAVIAAVCWLLFLMGYIRKLTTAFWTELGIVTGLIVIMRAFWYKQTEFKVLTSKEFEVAEKIVKEAIDEEVEDVDHFDLCVEHINQLNFMTYVNNHTKNITVVNYRVNFRDRLYNLFFRIIKKSKVKTKAQSYENFKSRIEYKATKLYKLSSSNTLTMSKSPLIDDRNNASNIKRTYIVVGTLLTVFMVAAIALVGFKPKQIADDVWLKLAIYVGSIIFTIAQTLIMAQISTKNAYTAYFNKLLTIINRYRQFKETHPVEGRKHDKPKSEPQSEQVVGEPIKY